MRQQSYAELSLIWSITFLIGALLGHYYPKGIWMLWWIAGIRLLAWLFTVVNGWIKAGRSVTRMR